MKSNGKKFLSALLVSSMVLTSSLGFMPRTAQAVDSSAIHSFNFEYINEDEAASNRQIVIKTEMKLESVDRRDFSIEGNTAEIGSIQWAEDGTEIKVEIEGVDPEILDYKLIIAQGALTFKDSNYQQLAPIEIAFKSYEIMPGFASIFKNIEEANTVFKNNTDKTEIKIILDSKHIKAVTGLTVSGEVNWTELSTETTDEVDSIKYTMLEGGQEAIRKVKADSDGTFKTTYAGETGIKNFRVEAFDVSGKTLDSQMVKYDFGGTAAPNFTAKDGTVFDTTEYSVQDIISGTVNLDDVLQGKSYAELMNVNVSYPNLDGVIKVANAGELAQALGRLEKNGDLADKSAKIKLTADIVLPSNVTFSHSKSLMIDGGGFTLSGSDITLGNPNNETANDIVKVSNLTVDGDITIDVGGAGDAYLTNVVVTTGNEIIVDSVGYSSATLTKTTADQMTLRNTAPVHIIAGQGTVIQNTDMKSAVSTDRVKLTSVMGGIFNVIKLENNNELRLIDESDSKYEHVFGEVQIAAGSGTSRLVLGDDTTLDKLTANRATSIVGGTNAKVLEAIASVDLASGAINANGASIGTYTPAETFANVSKVTEGVTEIPNSSDNAIVLGGNAYKHITSKEVNAGTAVLELKLESVGNGQPLNIKWNPAISGDQVATLLVDDGSGMNNKNNFTATPSTDGRTLKIQWKNTMNMATNKQFNISIDSSKFTKDMFESVISKLTSTEYTADFASKYAPQFREKIDGTSFNKFIVFMDNVADFDNAILEPVKVGGTVTAAELKWWEGSAQLKLTLTDVTDDDTAKYYLDNTAPKAYTDGGVEFTAAELQAAIVKHNEVNINVESNGTNANDAAAIFTLQQGHVWFATNATDADINMALKDDDIKVVHLAGNGDYGDSTPLTVGPDRVSTVEIVAYDVAGDSSIDNLNYQRTPNDLEKMVISGVALSADTGAPTITSVVGTTVEGAGDTIVVAFSENMDEESVELLTNWTFKMPDTATTGGAAIATTTATSVYDSATHKLTVTLDEATDSTFIKNGKFIEATPTTAIKDVTKNNDLAATAVYSAAITGDDTKPTLVSAVYDDVDTSSNVNVGDKIVFTFSEAIDKTTFDDGSLTAGELDTAFGISDSKTMDTTSYTISADKKVVTVTLAGTPTAIIGTTTVNPADAVKDLAGNADDSTAVTITGKVFSDAPTDGANFAANAATGKFTVASGAPTGTYKIYVAGSTTAAGSVEHTKDGGATTSSAITLAAGNSIEYTFTESGKEESAKVTDGEIPYATTDGATGTDLANVDFAVDANAKTVTYADSDGTVDIAKKIIYTDDDFATITTAAIQADDGTIDVTSLGLAGGETMQAAIVDDTTGNTGEAIALGTIPNAPDAGDLGKLAVTHDNKIINRHGADTLSLTASDSFVLYENDGGAGLALADNTGAISLAGNAAAGTESTLANDTTYASGDKVAYAIVDADGNTGVTSAEEELTFLTEVAIVDADADAEAQITLAADDVIEYTFGTATVSITATGTKGVIQGILKTGFTDTAGTADTLDDITPTPGTTDSVAASGSTIRFTVGDSDSAGKTLTTTEDTFEFTNVDDEVIDENGNSVFNAAAAIDPTVE